MSKWGDVKVDGAERIIEPKIYPVALIWDMSKLRKIIWLFLSYPASFLKLIWEQRNILVRRERVSFKDRLSYRVKDAIDVFWIIVFSACLVTVGWTLLFALFYWIKKIFYLFY